MSLELLASLAIFALSVTLIVAMVENNKLKRRTRHLEEEGDVLKAQARHKAARILDHAQEAAFQIANEALVMAEENKHIVKAKLEEVATKQLREYQKMVHDASDDVESEVKRIIGLKMDEEFARIKGEVEQYKQAQVEDINQKVAGVIKKVTKEVLGKSLDSTTHTKIVLTALEKAKKEYGLT